MSVRIIGIDPGFDRIGIAILEKEGAQETLLHSTCITTSKKDTFDKRLVALGTELETLLQEYRPVECAIEKLFFAKNQTTAMNVAEARGVILYVCSKYGLSIHEYSPPEIKVAVTGYGKAGKDDIRHMIPKILKLTFDAARLDDEMDAIAITLTHSAHRKIKAWK